MDSGANIANLALAASTGVLTLLALAAARTRSTPVGRSHLALLLIFVLASLVHLAAGRSPIDSELAQRVSKVAFVGVSALVLRLALQAARAPLPLAWRGEALVWGPPLVLFAIPDQTLGALWTSFAFALASIRVAGLPIRSWRGYGVALYAVSGALLLPAFVPLGWLAGLTAPTAALLALFFSLGVALVLHYGLPRLGLLSSDRVAHTSVIEAMGDGVLVVDMHGRLVDFNQAATGILGLDAETRAGGCVREVLAHHPDLVELFSGAIDGRSLYTPRCGPGAEAARTYDLQLSALCDAAGSIQSRVLVLRDITDRIAIEHEHQRQSRRLRMVHEVSAKIHEAESLDAGLEAVLALIARTMGFPTGHFVKACERGEDHRLEPCGIVYVESGLLDLEAVDPSDVEWWKAQGMHSIHAVPVLVGRRLHGVFEFFSDEAVAVDEVATELLEHVGDLVGRAIERRIAEERIRRLAYRDDLTGLPNRQRFHQLLSSAVSRAARSQRRMALLFMDLDGFKKVNDTMGHEVGDRLLAEVANRFLGAVRLSDHVGRGQRDVEEQAISRLGGDEFTVLLTEIGQPRDVTLVAERLLGTLEAPVVLAGTELFVSASIGISIYPDDGIDSESLLRNADAAMYFAKGRGRNRYQFYSEEMNRTRSGHVEIEARLRGAIEREELELHYQPILDAKTGEVVAAEALLRWIDGERGLISPDVFIPIAEESGQIVPLGRWVFETACRQAKAWREAGERPIRIGVNVSGHQIREPGMLEMVQHALDETGVSPEQMELEITESTIMQDDALTVQTLRALKRMGIGLALDDFGTGYSSLSYLRRFTIDRVKIDRSFVRELTENADDAALTSAIIAMAHGLRLKVVAEGVETTRHALFLAQRGCDELQGYLFGRPSRADEFADLLRARPRTMRDLEKEES
jgi:diguanylate cyclase (GGDEF)-like protein